KRGKFGALQQRISTWAQHHERDSNARRSRFCVPFTRTTALAPTFTALLATRGQDSPAAARDYSPSGGSWRWRATAFGWLRHNQEVILPQPTGKYAVGRAGFDWTDQNRPETFSGDPAAK